MREEEIFFDDFEASEAEPLRGTNFFVSAVLILKRQKKELIDENSRLKARLALLESQNAAFLNLSADRLLQTEG